MPPKRRRICFISGLWGTGKSTLVKEWELRRDDAFHFYDFDFGGGYPPPSDRAAHRDWRVRQSDFWLEFGAEQFDRDNRIPVVCGMCQYPSHMAALKNASLYAPDAIRYAFLTASDPVRKQRLENRGDGLLFENKPWYNDWLQQMKAADALEIPTDNRPAREVLESVLDWLHQP